VLRPKPGDWNCQSPNGSGGTRIDHAVLSIRLPRGA